MVDTSVVSTEKHLQFIVNDEMHILLAVEIKPLNKRAFRSSWSIQREADSFWLARRLGFETFLSPTEANFPHRRLFRSEEDAYSHILKLMQRAIVGEKRQVIREASSEGRVNS